MPWLASRSNGVSSPGLFARAAKDGYTLFLSSLSIVTSQVMNFLNESDPLALN